MPRTSSIGRGWPSIGPGLVLGATIVARHAGEMINEISLAIVAGVGLKTLAEVLRAYPTQAEAIRIAANRYRASRLKWWRRSLLRAWLNRWRALRRP